MTTHIWGYVLLVIGSLMGFYRVSTDPHLLTLASFSLAVAGVLLLINPYRLRWLVVLFLTPSAVLGVLGIAMTRGHLLTALTWIGIAILPALQLFSEVERRQHDGGDV